jgi:hypothetical protein
MSGDPIGKLPRESAAKLRALEAREQDLSSAARDLAVRRMQIVDRRVVARTNLEGAGHGGFGPSGRRAPPRENDIAYAQSIVDGIEAELAAVDQRLARIDARRSPLPARLNDWLRTLPPGTELFLHPTPPAPQLGKGQTSIAAVEQLRERILELRADRHQVASSPYPASMVKEAMRRQVATLGERGCPDALKAVEIGVGIKFPSTRETIPGLGGAGLELHDALAFACWLFPDQIIARLDDEIDAMASPDDQCLTDDARHQREAAILAEINTVERLEEATIELAESQGTEIRRRDDASPLAVLSLAAPTGR